jgi:hypothetical protein
LGVVGQLNSCQPIISHNKMPSWKGDDYDKV